MKYLFSRGELKRKAADHKLWNEGVILETPHVNEGDEPFIEIQIITLKAYLQSQAIDLALERGASLATLDESVSKILTSELNTAKEFIEVTPDYIRVGINCDLIDDKVITDVWDLLSCYNNLVPGTKLELGQSVHVYENKTSFDKRTH
jgi:hypothetical protein